MFDICASVNGSFAIAQSYTFGIVFPSSTTSLTLAAPMFARACACSASLRSSGVYFTASSSLTSGISATEARRKAQEPLGQARGNAAFAKIAARPGAFNVAYEKIGRVEYYGGTALGLGAGDEPPPVEGLGDFPEEPYGLDDPAI